VDHVRENVPCESRAGCDGAAILEKLEQVLDPGAWKSRSSMRALSVIAAKSGHASVGLRLPTIGAR